VNRVAAPAADPGVRQTWEGKIWSSRRLAQAPMQDNVSPSTRWWLRALFWLGVTPLWVAVGGIIAFIAAAVLFTGQPSGVLPLAKAGLPAAALEQALGTPTERYTAAGAVGWAEVLGAPGGCERRRISGAWLYAHWFKDDAIVYLDRDNRVLCAVEKGSIIHLRSY